MVGDIDLAIDPAYHGMPDGIGEQTESSRPPLRGLALVAHPHPLYGGSRDNKVVTTLSRAISNLGFHVLRPNFRGVGLSPGSFDQGHGESADLQLLVQQASAPLAPAWWHQEGESDLPWPGPASDTANASISKVGPRWILAGFSFGAFVQTLVQASTPNLQAIVLVGLAVTRFAPQVPRQPYLLIHGDQDDVIAYADIQSWASSHQLDLTCIPGAGHFFHGQLPQLKEKVHAFLAKQYNHA